MSLSFQNAYTEDVYIALLWFDNTCKPDPWRKIGWFLAAPGETVEVFSGDLQQLQDPNWAWFAEAGYADGPCWSGDPNHSYYAIPHNASFDQCYDDNTGCNAGYPFITAQFDARWGSLTILLLGPGTAGQGFQGFAWAVPQFLPQAETFLSGTLGPSTVTASATWTLNNQGFWNFNGHIHESGVLGHDYGFGMVLNVKDANGNSIGVVHSGSVEPNLPFSNPDDSWNDQGFYQRIVDLWPAIANATCHSGLNVTTTPGQILEGVLELLGVGAVAVLVAVGGALIGSDGKNWECPNSPQVNVSGDNGGVGVDVVWQCSRKDPQQ